VLVSSHPPRLFDLLSPEQVLLDRMGTTVGKRNQTPNIYAQNKTDAGGVAARRRCLFVWG
jgi:hypothetical protein